MNRFYSISHNTAFKRGMPEIQEIVAGMREIGFCVCGVQRREPTGNLQVRLGKTRAKVWPDLLACGDYPCFVISERFLNAMQSCGVRVVLGGQVEFVEPNRSGLSLEEAPKYYWVDGTLCRAAKMDFDASGYVDVRFCPHCGRRSDNIALTYERRNQEPPPGDVFDYDASLGLDLFTTDLSPTAFFCTDRVLDCVRTHKLVNVALRPVEQGSLGSPLKL
jgi:hypothetical protein